MSAREPVADAHHQVFRVMEFVESVSRVQEDVAGDERLQNQHLIESIMVVAFVDDVMPDAEIDGEYRHGEFRAQRHPHTEPLAEWLPIKHEFGIVVFIVAGDVLVEVGAFVVLSVKR